MSETSETPDEVTESGPVESEEAVEPDSMEDDNEAMEEDDSNSA